MRKHVGRASAVVAAVAMGLAVSPAIASAADGDGGLKEGPVQWWAEGNDQCEVNFHIDNTSNSTGYFIDYVVDTENATEIDGAVAPTGETYSIKYDGVTTPRTVGRIGVQAKASEPHFQVGEVGYIKDAELQTNANKVNLRDLTSLPNADNDEHTITYQMVLGPDSKDKGWNFDTQTFPEYTTTVTGCAVAEEEANGSMGSVFGSLFGSLGSMGSTGSADTETVAN